MRKKVRRRRVRRKGVFEEVILPATGLPDRASYTAGEVARMLGISTSTFWRRVKDGTYNLFYFVPPHASSRTTRFYRSDLVEFFEANWREGGN